MKPDDYQWRGSILPCQENNLTTSITVKVVGEDGTGLPGIAIELRDRSRRRIASKTSATGLWVFNGLTEGAYSLCIPGLDQDAWEVTGTENIAGDTSRPGRADWATSMAVTPEDGRVHRVLVGECIASIAQEAGFFPDTVWQHPRNQALRDKRESMYILNADDEVFIPALRQKVVADIPVGTLVTVLRKGVPERLKVRFLQSDGAPRSYVLYHLHIETDAGDAFTDRVGVANGDGLIVEWIPPNSRRGRLTLIEQLYSEEYALDLGGLVPITEGEGCAQRLTNLSYLTNEEELALGLKRFQENCELPPSGETNDATLSAISKKFQC
ncbi:carboxypeptidase-like regulatory domain-containing protein [Pseudomonas sp. McL0111]|uniref:carboxypeptidase-like regulatory domain-containing protein n=1 Tax=Pseudomonas sp. McL0111 TaxID=3457357 RepID=UPI00403E99C1